MADPVTLAITVALNAASMALTAMNKIEGPRLDDLSVTTADYGTPLVQFYGTRRLENLVFYAENIREEKHKNKTKGGKYTEYKYYGTFAVFIADHQIEAVLKIWLDRHLVFDRTGTSGPITRIIDGPFGIDMKLENSNKLRIYYGTETQDPDPRMVAKIEEKEGPGMCPAYLGVAYAFFEELPLEKFGNRMPQCSMQATRSVVEKFPYSVRTSSVGSGGREWALSSGGGFMAYYDTAGGIEWWSASTYTLLGSSPYPGVFAGSVQHAAVSASGTCYMYGTAGPPTTTYLIQTAPVGPPLLIPCDASNLFWAGVRVFSGADVLLPGGLIVDLVYGLKSSGTGYYVSSSFIDHEQRMVDVCLEAEGDIWGLFEQDGASDEITLQNMSNGETHTLTGLTPRVTPGAAYLFHTPYGHFVVLSDNMFYLVDDETFELKASGDLVMATPTGDRVFNEAMPGAQTFWDIDTAGYREYDCRDCSLIRQLNKFSWVVSSAAGQVFDPGSLAVWERQTASGPVYIRFIDRVDGGPYVLGDICEDVGLQAGFEVGEYNFTDLDQLVPGYSWTQGPAKDVIAPLLELWDSDIRPHGWIQEGLKRGKPLSGETISSPWMVPSGEDAPLYEAEVTAETELPRRVFATFADPAMEEQPNTAAAQRNASSVKTKRELSYDLGTLQIPADDIQPLLERCLRRLWVGSLKFKCRLSPLEIRLEPGDVRHILLEDEDRIRARCLKTTIRADRSIDTEWEQDGEVQVVIPDWESDDANPLSNLFNSPGGVTFGRPDEPVLVPIQTNGFVMDIPLTSDADDQTTPFIYLAAAPYGPGFWPGAMVFNAENNEADTVYDGGFDSFSSDEQATWGYTLTVLPETPTDVMDEGSVLTVSLPGGDVLASTTDDELLADQTLNMALVGDELIQFRDAELVSANTYELSGLIRGVRGTEWAVADHVYGERFLLITGVIHKNSIGASEIGDTDYYKFSTTGDDLDAVAPQALEFTAAAHKPYSPAHLEVALQDTGDFLITWQRRTRIGGSTLNGQDVPLGESTELYRVKIMDGDDVVQSYDVTDEDKLYTTAEQTTDWGSPQSALTVHVCQVSPVLSLEGFEAEASG